MMALAGVELETLVSELNTLTTRPLIVYYTTADSATVSASRGSSAQ